MKKRIVTVLSMLLVVAMMVSFTACGGGTTPAPSTGADVTPDTNISDETLVWAVTSDPNELGPFDSGSNGCVASELIYDSLIFYNSNTGEYLPKFATSWETIDECTIRYHLRDDVYASDGSKLTANDVLYTFELGLANEYSKTEYSFYAPDKFVIHDDFTIDIVTNAPYNLAFAKLAAAQFNIISKSVTEANGGYEAMMRNPINGTGPYKFVEWKTGESILLERKDKYWGNMPYYKYIEIDMIADKTAAVLALESGDIDGLNELAAPLAADLEAHDGCEVLSTPSEACVYFGMNTKNEYFSNKLVRQAVACAINKGAVVSIFVSGYGTTVDVLAPAQHTFYAPVPEELITKLDIEKAKGLMEEAGYANGFSVKLLVPAPYQKAAEIVQANLKDINITVELDVREISAWVGASIEGAYDTIIGTYFAGNPNQLYYNLDNRVPTGGKNYSNFGSDEYHELLDALYAEPDIAKARVICADLLAIYAQEFPGVPLCSQNALFGYKSGLSGFYTTTKGNQLHLEFVRPAA